MLEILKFVFSSFWVFLGTWLLLAVAIDGLVKLVAVLATLARRG